MNLIEWLIYAAAFDYVCHGKWQSNGSVFAAANVLIEAEKRIQCSGNAVVSPPLVRGLSLKA